MGLKSSTVPSVLECTLPNSKCAGMVMVTQIRSRDNLHMLRGTLILCAPENTLNPGGEPQAPMKLF